jgi:hypothetical protein
MRGSVVYELSDRFCHFGRNGSACVCVSALLSCLQWLPQA